LLGDPKSGHGDGARATASCEHTFVTSQGAPYGRFKRALASGNLMQVRAAAAELPAVPLRDALEVCELLRRANPEVYERAALRWLALLLERPGSRCASSNRPHEHSSGCPMWRRYGSCGR